MNRLFRVYIDNGRRYVSLPAKSRQTARRAVASMLRDPGYLHRPRGQRGISRVVLAV